MNHLDCLEIIPFITLKICLKMKRGIFLSLKPNFATLISKQKKTHEFRKYSPKLEVDEFFIYVTSPVAKIKFLAEVGTPVQFPEKIKIAGEGNDDFDKGLKKAKFAFPIIHFHELNKPIPLEELRERFNFTPPQSFAYDYKYPNLVKQLKKIQKKKVF